MQCKQILKDKFECSQHKCGYFMCNICNEYVQRNGHLCYIQRIKEKDDTRHKKKKQKMNDAKAVFIFWDTKTTQQKQ